MTCIIGVNDSTRGGIDGLLLTGSSGPLASWYVGRSPQHPDVVTVCTGRHRDTETPSHRDSPAGAERFAPTRNSLGASGARTFPPVPPKFFSRGATTSIMECSLGGLGVSVSLKNRLSRRPDAEDYGRHTRKPAAQRSGTGTAAVPTASPAPPSLDADGERVAAGGCRSA